MIQRWLNPGAAEATIEFGRFRLLLRRGLTRHDLIASTSPMQAQRQEYPPYTTLKSSSDLGWSALVAELRSYPPSEGSGPAAPQARIAIVLGGSEGIATYKIGGHWRSARTTPRLMWLKPAGGKHDEARIASKV
jgi:hypothetical protein